MRPKKLTPGALLALGALLILTSILFGRNAPQSHKGIETAATQTSGKITVIALYPTVGTIKDLLTLRQSKLIDIPNLAVVGVYHEKEITNYEESKAFVAKNGLDWTTFHPVSAPISAETTFQKNACTPEFEKIFALADGIIFFGGPDIPPSLYKEKASFLTNIKDPYRHFLEVSFIFHLLGGYQNEGFQPLLEQRPDFPILGLCLGCQSLNVGTGGTLTQDIWSEVYGAATVEDAIALGPHYWHANPYTLLLPQERFADFVLHEIQFADEGRFQKEIGWNRNDHPFVYSSHHQQAEKLGKGLRVIASSLDGKVVEAIEHERFRHILGVQFHPEASDLFDPAYQARFTPQDKESLNPKAYLVNHPPSLQFHQKLWSWVSRAWLEQHQRK